MGDELVGYWKLDEGEGFHARDSSGGGNGLTLTRPSLWTVGHRSNIEDSIFSESFFLHCLVGCGLNDGRGHDGSFEHR